MEYKPIYWALWMPSYTHGEFDEETEKHTFEKKQRRDPEPKEISDELKINDESVPLELVVQLQDNKDINLIYTELKTKRSHKILLKKIDHSCNGLFLYECICLTEDYYTKKLSKKPRYATNHAIKELYHKHLFHGDPELGKDEDWGLKICVIDTSKSYLDINCLKQINNIAIKHYLKEIEDEYLRTFKLFEERLQPTTEILLPLEHLSNISPDLEQILPEKKDAVTKILSEINSEKLNKLREKLKQEKNKNISRKLSYEESNRIVGKTLFTDSLCCSKYLKPEEDEEIRRFLLNIKNLKTGLHYIRDYYRYELDTENITEARNLAKWGVKISWASILLAIVGIVYSYYSSVQAKNSLIEQQKNIEILFLKQDSLISDKINNFQIKDAVSEIDTAKPVKKP